MRMLNVIAFFAVLALAQPAFAGATGAELLGRCGAAEKSMEGGQLSGEEMLDAMWCMGYVSGLLDGFSVGDYKVGEVKMMCPPGEELTRAQALRIVTKWLREHPDALQKSGRRGALLALSSAYPCR